MMMDSSEEWKSMWPISSVFSAPLLLSSGGGGESPSESTSEIGPLIFNPCSRTLTLLLSSPSSLSPHLPPPFPHLSLSRFLSTSPSPNHPSSLLPSTSSSVAAQLSASYSSSSSAFHQNRLQLLHCPGSNSVIVFFPTGQNSDRVGFVVLSVEDSNLSIKRADGDRDGGGVFTSKEKFSNRILTLLVNPVPHSCSGSGTSSTTIGYLMTSSMYAVHWFRVRIRGLGSDSEKPPFLDFLGSKLFKSCSVAHCCWSQHLPEESLVLLDSGELFMFDSDSYPNKTLSFNRRICGKRISVSWKDYCTSLEKGRWLSCEFSWHPRILIVAHSCDVFLVDLRFDGCNVSCLLKIDTLAMDIYAQTDRFIAFSKAGADGFCFVVASVHWLLLCDVRKPFMPLLQWAHDLPEPLCITVLSLSELRSHSKDDRFKWASESGYCIVVGSFWNCEFCLFFYGPPLRGTVASKISTFSKSLYAWELPSELSLSGRDCCCGSCLVREEFSKDALPKWMDWQHKKDIVLGFGIIDKDLHIKLSSEHDSFNGFTLIRLMSSGKLESQLYRASLEFSKVLEGAHKESPRHFEDSLLYAMGEGDYKFPRRFKYLALDFLKGFMKENLTKLLFTKMERASMGACEMAFNVDFHQCICEKLRAFGFRKLRSPPFISGVFKDIRFLTSIHEVALRTIWASSPTDLLQLAFSSYSELLEVLVDPKVSLEFLDVPSQPQLPPFVFRTPSCRSAKWSQKLQPGTSFVGPVLPTPVLSILRNLRMGEEANVLSANAQLNNQCTEVLRVATEMATAGSISLSDDKDTPCYDTQKGNPISLHKPVALSCEFSTVDPTLGDSVCNNEKFTTFVSKAPVQELVPQNRIEMVGPELFNSLSPLELNFDDCRITFGQDELKAFKLLARQYSNFLQDYQEWQVARGLERTFLMYR